MFSSLFILLGLAQYANHIPFIFQHQLLVTTFIGYVVLGVLLIFVLKHLEEIDKSEPKDSMLKTKNIAWIGYFSLPLVLGYGLSHLTPIPADAFASEFTIKEFTVTKLHVRKRLQSSLSMVTVVDRYNNPKSFLLTNKKVNKLNLKHKDTIIVIGRSSYFGLVIDNINGVQVN